MTKLLAFAVPLAVASVAIAQATSTSTNNVHLPRYPSVSPDGTSVVFTWRGDLYRVEANGGTARRLTSNPQDDNFSMWSPDGSRIAFTSERVGGGNLFTMKADGTDVKQVSKTDRYMVVTGWNDHDGLTLNSRLEQDWFPSLRSYAIPADGGEPTRLFDAFGSWPVVSPDGTKILFTRGGFSWSRRGYRGPDARDVWLYDREKKSYTQLTRWPGNDGRAKWLDDSTIVYTSDREDATVNLYSLKLGEDESKAVRLTKNKGVDVEEYDFSRDGKTIVYASWDHLYRLDTTRAEPKAIDILADEDAEALTQYRQIDRNVTESALSPDGKAMAVVAFGQVYVRGIDKGSATRRVNKEFGRCGDVAWSPDGSTLYFSSDVGGENAIYAATVTLSRGDVKKALGVTTSGATTANMPAESGSTGAPPTGRRRPTVRPAAPGEEGSATEDAEQAATQASPAPTIAPGDPTTVPTIEPTVTPSEPTTLPVSPATQASSQPATTTAPTTGPATTQAAGEENPGAAKWADALRFDVQKFITAPAGVAQPSPSPDGKRFAYQRGVGQLVVRDLATGDDKVLEDGWSEELSWRWSPDSRWIAYVTEDRNNNADIYIARADGAAKPVNISKHPDNDYAPRWSADGKILAFLSQRNENEADVYAVYLDKSLESLQGVDLDQYFKDAAGKAAKRERPKKKPATRPATTAPSSMPATTLSTDESAHPWHPSTITTTTISTTTSTTAAATTTVAAPTLDLDDAYLRIRRLTALPGPEGDLEITPAGDKIVFSASSTGGRGIFVLDRDAPEPRRIANSVNIQGLTFEGDKAVVVNFGSAGTMNLSSGAIEAVEVADRLAIPISEFNEQRFREASRVLGARYYDANLNGLDWPAVTKRYLDLIKTTTTAAEFEHVANKFIGELNGSHLGISVPDAPNPEAITNGRLGIVAKREDDGYRVMKIYADGPASKGVMKLEASDVITAIEAEPFEKTDTLESKLAGRIGKETLVTVKRGGKEVQLLLTPISFEAETGLAYDDWRNAMAKKVADLSGGKLGYIHVRGMDQGSLDIFERDLFAAADGKKGLIIDVRNNGGGWTTDRLLASIMYPRHAYTRPRGDKSDATDSYPQDRLFIQKYDLPIDMLCNEKSFSNAEIVSHAFKTLKRGTLVGQQTAGGVISTGGMSLLDGTTVRLPGRGWYTPDGTNMEMHGAMPDVLVPQTPEAESKSADEQLNAAVDDLLKRVK
jgi:tricorn protease